MWPQCDYTLSFYSCLEENKLYHIIHDNKMNSHDFNVDFMASKAPLLVGR